MEAIIFIIFSSSLGSQRKPRLRHIYIISQLVFLVLASWIRQGRRFGWLGCMGKDLGGFLVSALSSNVQEIQVPTPAEISKCVSGRLALHAATPSPIMRWGKLCGPSLQSSDCMRGCWGAPLSRDWLRCLARSRHVRLGLPRTCCCSSFRSW